MLPANAHKAIAPLLSATCLADIEGLDAQAVGFCRSECCNIPSKLAGSFGPITRHSFLGTGTPPTQWDKKACNVLGYSKLQEQHRTTGDALATLFFSDALGNGASPLLVFSAGSDNQPVSILEYHGLEPGTLPAPGMEGVISSDRSDERFIFVCSHRGRDDRCGYCGPILVELIRKALSRYPAQLVHVFPCSHIGGHVYAGNVLCYSKFSGCCFGCVTPSLVDVLVDYVATHSTPEIPHALQINLRGRMFS